MKFLRNVFAFLLMPAIIAAWYTFIKNFLYFAISAEDQYIPFWVGVICYIVFQIVLYRPMRTYVFGHELSHAIAGILSGAKIKKFSITKESGSVALTKDNVWITLAPYFFPVYTFAIIIIYIFLGWFIDIRQLYEYFIFLIGFSVAFHVALTIYVLKMEQPDLKVYGAFFSFVVIFTVNILIFTLLAALAFPDTVNVRSTFIQIFSNIICVYNFIYTGVLEIWLAFQKTK
jgi:hypothetical protein